MKSDSGDDARFTFNDLNYISSPHSSLRFTLGKNMFYSFGRAGLCFALDFTLLSPCDPPHRYALSSHLNIAALLCSFTNRLDNGLTADSIYTNCNSINNSICTTRPHKSLKSTARELYAQKLQLSVNCAGFYIGRPCSAVRAGISKLKVKAGSVLSRLCLTAVPDLECLKATVIIYLIPALDGGASARGNGLSFYLYNC